MINIKRVSTVFICSRGMIEKFLFLLEIKNWKKAKTKKNKKTEEPCFLINFKHDKKIRLRKNYLTLSK